MLGRKKRRASLRWLVDKKTNANGEGQCAGGSWISSDKAEKVEFPSAVFSRDVALYAVLGGLRGEVEASDLAKRCDDVSVRSTNLVATKFEDIIHDLTPDLGWKGLQSRHALSLWLGCGYRGTKVYKHALDM